MDNSNRNFEDNSKTVIFNPVSGEKENKKDPVIDDVIEDEVYYGNDDEEDEETEDVKSNVNIILISVVIALVILFIVALIWGVSVFNEMKNEENNKEIPQNAVENTNGPEIIENPQIPEEEKENKNTDKISFVKESIEESGSYYTVRVTFGRTGITERLTIDGETEIMEDNDRLSYKSFKNGVLKKLGSEDIWFDAVVDKNTKHIDKISYKSEIIKTEEGVVLNENTSEDKSSEGVALE